MFHYAILYRICFIIVCFICCNRAPTVYTSARAITRVSFMSQVLNAKQNVDRNQVGAFEEA